MRIINTVAGDSIGGYGGDGGPATSAKLNNPMSVRLDVLGNMYIADYGNARIRKVDVSTGIITTIAGDGSWFFNGDGILAISARLINCTATGSSQGQKNRS